MNAQRGLLDTDRRLAPVHLPCGGVALSVALRAAGDIPAADQGLEEAESLNPADPWVIWAREDQLPDAAENLSPDGTPSAA